MQKQKQSVSVPFSKYAQVDHPLVSDYVQSIATSLSMAQRNIASAIHFKYMAREQMNGRDLEVYENRMWLTKAAGEFHNKAGTVYSNSVMKSINNLLQRRCEIFVSIHQPNLFAYSGVFKKIVLLQVLKSRLQRLARSSTFPKHVNFVNLFVIVDHDFMEDRWMRTAQLPSVGNGDGVLELKTPVRHADRWKMVCNMPHPNRSIIDHWHSQIMHWLKHSTSSLSLAVIDEEKRLIMLNNLERFWDRVVDVAYKRCESYAEFNAFMMTHIVNGIFGYDTLFVPLSKLSRVFVGGYDYLLENAEAYQGALKESLSIFGPHGIETGVTENVVTHSPLWLHCKSCGSKASTKIIGSKLGGICMGCKKELNFSLNGPRDRSVPRSEAEMISPRAIPILMLLSRELDVAAYASGTGGSMGYVVGGLAAFSKLNVEVPMTVAWGGDDRYFGIGQWAALKSLNLNNKGECDDLLDRLRRDLIMYGRRIAPHLQSRRDKVGKGEEIKTVLQQIDEIKKEQRNARILFTKICKVHRAVNVKPCIIDYVVNFGMDRTVDIWENNLVQNDRLDVPALMV